MNGTCHNAKEGFTLNSVFNPFFKDLRRLRVRKTESTLAIIHWSLSNDERENKIPLQDVFLYTVQKFSSIIPYYCISETLCKKYFHPGFIYIKYLWVSSNIFRIFKVKINSKPVKYFEREKSTILTFSLLQGKILLCLSWTPYIFAL